MLILSIVPVACLIVAIYRYNKGYVEGELIAAWAWASAAQIFLGYYIIQVEDLVKTVYKILEKIQ
jgi:hypothetical protein